VTEIGFNDGFNGFVINEDVIQFKEKILKLLEMKIIRAHVKRIAASFCGKFSIKSNIKQLEAIKATINYNKFMFREIIKKRIKRKI
jgi:hypothetical protein